MGQSSVKSWDQGWNTIFDWDLKPHWGEQFTQQIRSDCTKFPNTQFDSISLFRSPRFVFHVAQFKLLYGFELDFCIVLIVLFFDCFNGLENPMLFVGLGLSNCCPACFAKFVGLSSVFVLFGCHSNSGLDFGHYLQWLSLVCEAKHLSIFRIFFVFVFYFLWK